MEEISQQKTEVLIIGAGPVGLFAANLLGKLGIPTVVVEKYATRRGQPKAHAVNPRTLEILRQWGFDTRKLRKSGADPLGVDRVRFMDNFTGWEFGSLPYERQFADVLDVTPEPLFNIAQPLVEDYLTEHLTDFPSVTVKCPVAWLDAKEDEFGNIVSTVLDRESGTRSQIRSRFLIACDGARATSREALGITFGPLNEDVIKTNHYVTVHFNADLASFHTGVLFFLMQPHGLTTFICYDRKEDWVFVFGYDPEKISGGKNPTEYFTEEECFRRVGEALGSEIPWSILSITIWSTSPKLADEYRSPKITNAFLAGDAAHTFSPTGGLGVNTGFADVHNLIWKISAVREGLAPLGLLDSYGIERRPVAKANASQSTVNEEDIGRLGRLVASHSKDQWGTAEFQGLMELAIAENADHFNSLDLQLGAIYDGNQRDPTKSVSQFVPSYVVGARLPHAWVERAGERVSSLDLILPSSWTVLSPNQTVTRNLAIGLSSQCQGLVWITTLGSDFTTPDQEWISSIFPGNRAVLVRPDQHIAAFVFSTSELEDALNMGLSSNKDRNSRK